MKAFTVKYNDNRYTVKPINGHSPRYKVNIEGVDVNFEHDFDGHVRAETSKVASTALLMALADKIEEECH
jgi:hypothetical protein